MLIYIYCVIFITWIRVSFCIKFLKKNKNNLKKKKEKKSGIPTGSHKVTVYIPKLSEHSVIPNFVIAF